jgi:hypothetical protein
MFAAHEMEREPAAQGRAARASRTTRVADREMVPKMSDFSNGDIPHFL